MAILWEQQVKPKNLSEINILFNILEFAVNVIHPFHPLTKWRLQGLCPVFVDSTSHFARKYQNSEVGEILGQMRSWREILGNLWLLHLIFLNFLLDRL
jgi:hypothetical protein